MVFGFLAVLLWLSEDSARATSQYVPALPPFPILYSSHSDSTGPCAQPVPTEYYLMNATHLRRAERKSENAANFIFGFINGAYLSFC